MKIMMCQINTTPGDFKGNVDQIKALITKAFEEEVDLAVFPELSIPGYLVRDMIYEKGFVEKNLRAVQEIISHYDVCHFENRGTVRPVVVVGYIDKNRSGVGKPFQNVAVAIHKGLQEGTYKKQLLPFYDVFDEGRYFEPGTDLTIIKVGNRRFGIIICEDGWNDKGMDNYDYRVCPLQRYRDAGVTDIISLNSSPFVKGKPQRRMEMIRRSSEDGIIVYVNQIGGQDELVFDGNSFICKNGKIVDEISVFDANQTYKIYNEDTLESLYKPQGDDMDVLYAALKIGLGDYIRKSGFSEIVVGSSGGIDSAVVLALAAEVLGPDKVHGIRMPSKYSSEGSVSDALTLHKNLGCNDYLVPISHLEEIKTVNLFLNGRNNLISRKYNNVADENWQARERGRIIMHFSNAYGVLPLTTGNKTELALGYCTLYGDMNGGFAPINDLYKLDVKEVARYINKKAGKEIIPVAIIEKAPSAELAPGQTDEASLLPYPILDPIVCSYIESYIGDFENYKDLVMQSADTASQNWVQLEGAKAQYDRMIRLIKLNEFKRRQAAPGIKVCKVAFGTGRRLPIVKR